MNPYSDYKNRGYMAILTSLFPEQTKTLPRIIVWSIIFLADLILGIGGAAYFQLLPSGKLAVGLLIVAIIGVFWLQGFLWFSIVNFFLKRRTLD